MFDGSIERINCITKHEDLKRHYEPRRSSAIRSLDAMMEEPIVAVVEGQKTSKVFSF